MHETDSQSVKIKVNERNELECIFIQTSFMRQWYIDFGDIRHIDSTFKVNVENFQLYISLTVNQHFNELDGLKEEKEIVRRTFRN